MQLTVNRDVLAGPLDECVKFAKSKVLPILDHVLLHADVKEGLTLTGGNGDVYLQTTIPTSSLSISSSGLIALPAIKFADLIKTLTSEISIEIDGLKATIKSGKKKLLLSGLNGEEYPSFSDTTGSKITIDGNHLKKVLNSVAYATAIKEDIPILKGIFLRLSNDAIQIRASDRNRVAVVNDTFESNIDIQTTIPSTSWAKLSRLIGDGELVTIIIGPSSFKAITTSYTFMSRILEGTYPMPDQLISRLNKETSFQIDTNELMQALERAHIIASDNSNIIKLSVSPDEVTISSQYDGNSFDEILPIHEFNGDLISISFNGKYAQEAMKSITSSKTEFSYLSGATNNKALMFSDIEMIDNYHIVMPYRTHS